MYKIWSAHIFCVRPEKPFLGKSGQKNQNCQFTLKLGTKTNLNMRNSMMMLTFSVFGHISFLGKFGPKVQKCYFRVEFDTKTTQSSKNMQNSMVISILFVLDWK